MNPETNRFEPLASDPDAMKRAYLEQVELLKRLTNASGMTTHSLYRADGSAVPASWSIFTVGEHVVIKNYTFKVAYVGETSILFEPVGPVVVGDRSGP